MNGFVKFLLILVILTTLGNLVNQVILWAPPVIDNETAGGNGGNGTGGNGNNNQPGGGNNSGTSITVGSSNAPYLGDVHVSATVEPDADGKVPAGGVSLDSTLANATVPEGVQMEDGATELTLTVNGKDESEADLDLSENEVSTSLDVHMAGVASDNAIPMEIKLVAAAAKGLNSGNIKLYHVENGETVEMVCIGNDEEFTEHNQFKYDPATGDVTLYVAGFSEFAIVSDTVNPWAGTIATGFSGGTGTESDPYIIANADQLAYFSAAVGGMTSENAEKNSFDGKFIKLIADINLGDKNDASTNLFYPIGYYNDAKSYTKPTDGTKTGASVTSFCGTFDGNGHTIANFYQNTWQMWGDYDGNYYKAAMGLFGYVHGGTVKNLTVDNFSSDGEFTPTGVIAAYADGDSVFENIAITNCNPRVYNTGNGGIIGIAGDTRGTDDDHMTLTNITVDNSNKISALWGSWDVACGGLVGMYRGNVDGSGNATGDTIKFTNCHVSAQIDVNNDVCANYQYYAYRYAGMIIGSVRHNTTNDEGRTIPNMIGITAYGCTVNFGTWNDYYYCELVANSLASYTHDHQMSRLVEVQSVDVQNKTVTDLHGNTTAIPTSGRQNYVVVNYSEGHGTANATCYHFVNGVQHFHDVADADNPNPTETVNGVEGVLKEDKQHLYLEFNNLFTGYGWGVSTIALDSWHGITVLDIVKGDVESSVEKFESTGNTSFGNGETVTIDKLFQEIQDNTVDIDEDNVVVTISPVDPNATASAKYNMNTTDEKGAWKNGTLTFSGTGELYVTITDYYFCKSTTVKISVNAVEKFETKFVNYKNYLYRVGNQNAIAISDIFKLKDGFSVDLESFNVTVDGMEGTPFTKGNTWETSTLNFSGFTGVVKVTISDGPTIPLEVVDAVNATAATSATSNNVVLLSDISGGFTVSGRYTVYGNGFTLNYTGNGQYLNNGLKQGVVTVSENGTLDNLRIKASIYPSAYIYYGKPAANFEYVQGGPSTVEGDKTRYHYQLSAVAVSGNGTISNCYIYGGRNNIFVNTGDVTIKDTILECGTVANVQIQSNASHTITLENVTTIQHQVKATIGDTSKVMLGAGILVGPETTENPKIVLNGDFKQYNWVNEDDAYAVSNVIAQTIINGAIEATNYNHTINGKKASNLGIIYMNEFNTTDDGILTNNTDLNYVYSKVALTYSNNTINGYVYSLQNETQIYTDYENADRTTVNGLYQPQFKYTDDLGGQYEAKTDDGDTFLYREGDTIYVMFPSGDTKVLDLAALVNIIKYTGQDLGTVISINDITVTDGKVTLSTAGDYTVTYTVTDSLFYDKDGNEISGEEKYSWNVTISVSLKDTGSPDAYFEFDSTKQKMGYYKPTFGDVKQYLPFLAGLKIYDYNGQTEYLRFNGDADFNKVASITITGYESNKALVEIKLTDGGVISTRFLSRANSGGASTYTGKIKTKDNVIYFVNDGGTSNKDTTTTAAYWYVDYYKFTGNNGVTIQSGQQTFNSTGSSASTPSGSFSTTIKYTVTYDTNGGNCGQNTGYATSASAAVTLPTPTRSGYVFAGWYTAASGGTRVGGASESYTPSANITLYAQWGKPCTVTYNANGGTCDTTSAKYSGTALTLPTPTRDGYWFIGWYDAATGGNKIGEAGATYNPGGDITLYAQWQEQVEYTVTYNANGGTCGTASATYQGTALTLPTPTRTGYKFNGWYTAASDGTKVKSPYTPSANITLYAQWEQISYTITISKQDNATVTVDKTTAHYNDTVSVTVSFSQNNSKTLTVKDASGNTVLSKSAAGTYTFTMPASNVTIEASSSGSCVTPDTLVTLADGSQKEIQYVTYEDQLLVWDFYTGEYTVAPSSIVMNHGYDNYNVVTLRFSDGTVVNTINGHGFYDMTSNKYVILSESNAADYIGHEFVKADGNGYSTVELVSYSVKTEYTESWSILTAEHYNCILEGMWTVTPAEVEGSPNYLMPYEIGEGMKYDEAKMQADMEKYGLYTYDDFAEYMTEEQFVALGLANWKVSVGKGYITWADIELLISIHIG